MTDSHMASFPSHSQNKTWDLFWFFTNWRNRQRSHREDYTHKNPPQNANKTMDYLASVFRNEGTSPISCTGPKQSWWFTAIHIMSRNEQWIPWQMGPLQVPRGVSLCRILLWQHCISHPSYLVFCTLAHARRKTIYSKALRAKTGIASVFLVLLHRCTFSC